MEAAVVDDPGWGRRVAFARLKLSDAIAVRWELAEISLANPSSGAGDEPHAFGVDSGIGCYMSYQVAEVLLRMEPSEREAQIAEWDRKIRSDPTAVGGTGALLDVKVGPGNVIAFATGIGDGYYWSWLGYDATGSVTALVTNFALFDLDTTRASWPGQP